MELTQRKKQILKIVVDSYINTAEPVGSKAIVALMPEKVRSATVRDALAAHLRCSGPPHGGHGTAV